jgi:hypothetical protein
MNLSSGVSLGQLLIAFSVLLVSGGVAWGGLLQRVKTLERDVDLIKQALPALQLGMATLVANTAHTKEAVDKLTDCWIGREPPSWLVVNPRKLGE